MGKAAVSIGARIARLQRAEQRAKLMKRGAKLQARPMAELCGVSWNTLKGWCDEYPDIEAKGAATRGGNGIEWEFDPRKTVAVLLQIMRKIRDGQAKKSRTLATAAGITLAAEDEAPSLQETKDLVNLTLTVVSATEKQGGYTPTGDMLDFLDGYNRVVVEGIMGVRTRVDPNGNLPPHIREAVDNHLRAVATEVHGEAMRFIGNRRARLQQTGTL